jgi:glycosyltransferase involved in cell wall biosynthesis
MKRIKILFVSHSSSIGGGEKCLLTLVKHLDRNLFEPVVIFPSEGSISREMVKLGIKTFISPLECWIRDSANPGLEDSDILDRLQNIKQIVEVEKPDIIHSNTSVVWEGALAAKLQGIIHIWHIHEILENHPRLKPLFPLPLVYWGIDFLSDSVVVVSNAVRETFSGIIQPEKLVTVHNGIEAERFAKMSESSIRQELALPSDTHLAVSIGTVIKEKGYDTLIEAASFVKKKQGNVKFIIVGSGLTEPVRELKKKIVSLNLKDHVYYLGYREDIPGILRDSDFLIISSITEAFPLVALEAMALGKPIIATNCGGIPELVSDAETGFLVPINAPESLSEKILYMIKDRKRMKEIGNRALARFDEHYRAETYTLHFENLYKELLRTHKQKPASKDEQILLKIFLESYRDLSTRDREAVQKDRIIKNISNSWGWRITICFRRIYAFLVKLKKGILA